MIWFIYIGGWGTGLFLLCSKQYTREQWEYSEFMCFGEFVLKCLFFTILWIGICYKFI